MDGEPRPRRRIGRPCSRTDLFLFVGRGRKRVSLHADRVRSYSLWSAIRCSLLKRNDVSIRSVSLFLRSSFSSRSLSVSLSSVSSSTRYVHARVRERRNDAEEIKRNRVNQTSTCQPTYLPIYQPTNLPTNRPTYLPTYLPVVT